MSFKEKISKKYVIANEEDDFKNFKVGDVVKITKGKNEGKYGIVRELPSKEAVKVETVDKKSNMPYPKNDIEKVITAGAMKELSMDIDEYLGENEDDSEDLYALIKDKEKFVSSPIVKNVCKQISPSCSPELLYQKLSKK